MRKFGFFRSFLECAPVHRGEGRKRGLGLAVVCYLTSTSRSLPLIDDPILVEHGVIDDGAPLGREHEVDAAVAGLKRAG